MRRSKYTILVWLEIVLVISGSFWFKSANTFPLDYDSAFLYGFPIPIWETYWQNHHSATRLLTGEYGSVPFNICRFPWNALLNIALPVFFGVLTCACCYWQYRSIRFIQYFCLGIFSVCLTLISLNLFFSWPWEVWRTAKLLLFLLNFLLAITLAIKYLIILKNNFSVQFSLDHSKESQNTLSGGVS